VGELHDPAGLALEEDDVAAADVGCLHMGRSSKLLAMGSRARLPSRSWKIHEAPSPA
jgi:hypothetical protein